MATPGPRYTHQSARITKAIARAFPIRGALRKSILRKLGTPDRRRGLEAGLCGPIRGSFIAPRARTYCSTYSGTAARGRQDAHPGVRNHSVLREEDGESQQP
jgi:hypothetical protein